MRSRNCGEPAEPAVIIESVPIRKARPNIADILRFTAWNSGLFHTVSGTRLVCVALGEGVPDKDGCKHDGCQCPVGAGLCVPGQVAMLPGWVMARKAPMTAK